MQKNPVLDLFQKALEDKSLHVELRGWRRGADVTVPPMFILYHTVGPSKVRVASVNADEYMSTEA